MTNLNAIKNRAYSSRGTCSLSSDSLAADRMLLQPGDRSDFRVWLWPLPYAQQVPEAKAAATEEKHAVLLRGTYMGSNSS